MNKLQDGIIKVTTAVETATAGDDFNTDFALYVDCSGYDFANIVGVLNTAISTKYGWDAFLVYEADVTNSSSMAVVVAASFSNTTSTNVAANAIPVASTAGGSCIDILLDLRKRKRYIAVTTQSDTACIHGSVCKLYRKEQAPPTQVTPGGAVVDGVMRVLV